MILTRYLILLCERTTDMTKKILIMLTLTMAIFSSAVNAEDAATPTSAPPQKSAQTKVVPIAEAMQLTDAQKTALQTLQKLKADHLRQMQVKYNELQLLAEADKLDKDKVEEVTDVMVDMVRKFSETSTKANHDFYSSLTPDQRTRLTAINKQLKQRQQQAINKKPQQ